LHTTRGLHNLIWVYSVTGYKDGETFSRPIDFYYPGADVVDVVGIDLYDDEATMRSSTDYAALKAFKKPLAITEFGPNSINDGSLDQQKLLVSLKEKYPEVIYWLSWHDWRRSGTWIYKSIVNNRNAKMLLDDSVIVNREQLPAIGKK
jgi:beta-mannanase